MNIKPYKTADSAKKVQIEQMFDHIAPHYDFLNHFLSFGIDRCWRRKAIGKLKSFHPGTVLDVASGTGDLALEAFRKLKPEKIVGIDISEQMLESGRVKLRRLGLENKIELIKADVEKLPFADNSFDAVMVAFGVRNFENLKQGLSEMRRVIKPGGKAVILEFSTPSNKLFNRLYHLYSFTVLPFFGKLVSSDSSAYQYLPESVKAFPSGTRFTGILASVGFKNENFKELTMGIATIYSAEK